MSFDVPASLPASGLLSITIANHAQQVHQANLARLNDGVTRDQVSAILKTSPDQVVRLVTFVGGPNSVDPGKSQTVVLDMEPGTYVAICLISDPGTGKPHFMLGMHQVFTVQ